MNRLRVHLLVIAVFALAAFLPQRAAGAGTNESFVFRVGLSSACFGNYSACLVDESAFEIMKELNPQVGQTLQVVAESEPFADVVVCVAIRGWESEKLRADTIKSLGELHLQPTGQQILTLFKIDGIVPFQESQLDTIRKLRAGSESLTNKATL